MLLVMGKMKMLPQGCPCLPPTRPHDALISQLTPECQVCAQVRNAEARGGLVQVPGHIDDRAGMPDTWAPGPSYGGWPAGNSAGLGDETECGRDGGGGWILNRSFSPTGAGSAAAAGGEFGIALPPEPSPQSGAQPRCWVWAPGSLLTHLDPRRWQGTADCSRQEQVCSLRAPLSPGRLQ